MITRDPAPAEVLAALAALVPGDWVATDADGTLWAGDCGDDCMRWLQASREPGLDVAGYLAQEQVDYAGACRASALHLDRLGGPDPGLRAFLAERLRPRIWLLDGLRAAAARGIHIQAVTAAPSLAAREALAHFGLPWPVIGVAVAAGRILEPAPIGPGKPAAWQAAGLPRPALALGDSVHDEPLLAHASRGFRLLPPTAGETHA